MSGELKAPVQQSAGERVALQGERQGWNVGGEEDWEEEGGCGGGRLLLVLVVLVLLLVLVSSVGEGGVSASGSSTPGPGLLCGGDCWRKDGHQVWTVLFVSTDSYGIG